MKWSAVLESEYDDQIFSIRNTGVQKDKDNFNFYAGDVFLKPRGRRDVDEEILRGFD